MLAVPINPNLEVVPIQHGPTNADAARLADRQLQKVRYDKCLGEADVKTQYFRSTVEPTHFGDWLGGLMEAYNHHLSFV